MNDKTRRQDEPEFVMDELRVLPSIRTTQEDKSAVARVLFRTSSN